MPKVSFDWCCIEAFSACRVCSHPMALVPWVASTFCLLCGWSQPVPLCHEPHQTPANQLFTTWHRYENSVGVWAQVPSMVRAWRHSGCMAGLGWERHLRCFSSTGAHHTGLRVQHVRQGLADYQLLWRHPARPDEVPGQLGTRVERTEGL